MMTSDIMFDKPCCMAWHTTMFSMPRVMTTSLQQQFDSDWCNRCIDYLDDNYLFSNHWIEPYTFYMLECNVCSFAGSYLVINT